MKTFLVARYELVTLLRKPAFLIIAVALPLVGVLVMTAINLSSEGEGDADPAEQELQVEGFVDQSGLIKSLPVIVHSFGAGIDNTDPKYRL